MSNRFEPGAEELSALADGELDDSGVSRACLLWCQESESRQTWHAYHLIGDVLRSEDLASSPGRDLAGLARLRQRLALEPAVLAPETAVRARQDKSFNSGTRRSTVPWAAASAIAAGFAAVAAVLFALRGPMLESGQQGVSLARSGPVAEAFAQTPNAGLQSAVVEPATMLVDGKLVRDSRLDRYLDAHRHFSGSSALGVPSAFLRGVTSDASNR